MTDAPPQHTSGILRPFSGGEKLLVMQSVRKNLWIRVQTGNEPRWFRDPSVQTASQLLDLSLRRFKARRTEEESWRSLLSSRLQTC